MQCYGRSGDGASVIKQYDRVDTQGGILVYTWSSARIRVVIRAVLFTWDTSAPRPAREDEVFDRSEDADRCMNSNVAVTAESTFVRRWVILLASVNVWEKHVTTSVALQPSTVRHGQHRGSTPRPLRGNQLRDREKINLFSSAEVRFITDTIN